MKDVDRRALWEQAVADEDYEEALRLAVEQDKEDAAEITVDEPTVDPAKIGAGALERQTTE